MDVVQDRSAASEKLGVRKSYGATIEIPVSYGIEDPNFRDSASLLLGSATTHGNEITCLQNGVEIFPAMLEAIEQATETITMETFIYWSGEIGKKFSDAFAKKAREGVKVHLLLDWFGCKDLDKELIAQMQSAGVEVKKYHIVSLLQPLTLYRSNHRTHRKVLVVDGRTGFIGGVGIADEWRGNADGADHWRDSHYRVRGPAVAHLQVVFLDNWIKAAKVVLMGEPYFPKLEPVGEETVQVFKSSPQEGTTSVRLMYLLALAAAKKSILISSPYFVPDTTVIAYLLMAKDRGVSVDVLVPGSKVDYHVVKHGSRYLWGKLLESGVRIHEYQPAMLHHKIMIVDGYWTSVGSTNLDNRSLHVNDEANLNVFSKRISEQLTRVYEKDLEDSEEVTFAKWRSRPIKTKCFDMLSHVFHSQL